VFRVRCERGNHCQWPVVTDPDHGYAPYIRTFSSQENVPTRTNEELPARSVHHHQQTINASMLPLEEGRSPQSGNSRKFLWDDKIVGRCAPQNPHRFLSPVEFILTECLRFWLNFPEIPAVPLLVQHRSVFPSLNSLAINDKTRIFISLQNTAIIVRIT
jgi:hypothetical protein